MMTDEIERLKNQNNALQEHNRRLVKELQKIVRCKDCRKGKTTDEDELFFCQVFQKWFAETFFCADGERKGGEE